MGYSEIPLLLHQPGPAGPLFKTPQDVAPKAGNGEAPLDYGIKGITWSISGKKTNIDFNCPISFLRISTCFVMLSHDGAHGGHDIFMFLFHSEILM